jgi:hypothetical protein
MRNRSARFIGLMLAIFSLGLSVSACAQAPQISPQVDQAVFLDASQFVGKQMELRGFLRYTFENENLFPAQSQTAGISERYCLPILIKEGNANLVKTAKGLDGSLVVVTGKIVKAASNGMFSVNTCKQIGIDVTSIRKAN